jgi:hypothetical protein
MVLGQWRGVADGRSEAVRLGVVGIAPLRQEDHGQPVLGLQHRLTELGNWSAGRRARSRAMDLTRRDAKQGHEPQLAAERAVYSALGCQFPAVARHRSRCVAERAG